MESSQSFSSIFQTPPVDELRRKLSVTTFENLDISSMSRRDVDQFLHWLDNYSPISHINIHQTISSAFLNRLPSYNNNLPIILPTPGDELSDILLYSINSNANVSNRASSAELLDWLNFGSPITRIVDLNLSSAFLNYRQNHGYSFSTMFPTLGDDLSHKLIHSILHNIPNASDFIEWLNSESPISPFYINETISLAFVKYIQYQYQYLTRPLSDRHLAPVGYVNETAVTLVDDQSSDEYEDLLDLQEQIGHVSVGLTEKTISMNLKTTTFIPSSKILVKDEICVVCQDEYKLNETIGTLHCRHIYHENCIKQWLLQKNVCPICNATALVDLDKDLVE